MLASYIQPKTTEKILHARILLILFSIQDKQQRRQVKPSVHQKQSTLKLKFIEGAYF